MRGDAPAGNVRAMLEEDRVAARRLDLPFLNARCREFERRISRTTWGLAWDGSNVVPVRRRTLSGWGSSGWRCRRRHSTGDRCGWLPRRTLRPQPGLRPWSSPVILGKPRWTLMPGRFSSLPFPALPWARIWRWTPRVRCPSTAAGNVGHGRLRDHTRSHRL
jgi:hypothetical protein